MAAQAQKRLRIFACLLSTLIVSLVIALGASTSAHAANATATIAAANAVDGYCDPFNDLNDPDCWDDTGDDGDNGNWNDNWGDWNNPDYGNPPSTTTPSPTAPTGPIKQPTPPAPIQWPAPPKGAYAKLHSNHRTASIPKGAPAPIKKMIHAANSITRKPYVWGGGHGAWYSRGYDCSGATSFVLHAGGYLSSSLVSGDLAKWGSKGAGNWVRIYANRTHVFMVIAGLRFDTSSYGAGGGSGPRWRNTVRPTGGFKLRHPTGL